MLNLVTGGAGFLGSHLVDALIAQGEQVIILDNLSSGSLANVGDALRSGRATFIHLDITQPLKEIRDSVAIAARQRPIQHIFHFAAPRGSHGAYDRPWEALRVDSIGTIALIDLALEHKARLFYASTPYASRDLQASVPQSDRISAADCYSYGKRFGEMALAFSQKERGLDARVARIFNCYGPRMPDMDSHVILELASAILLDKPLPMNGSGLQSRSMIYVDDAIRLLLFMREVSAPRSAPLDIASDEELTTLELVRTFAQIACVPLNIVHRPSPPEDVQRARPNLAEARTLGYVPQIGISEGLGRTIAWYRERVRAYV